jgi:hypothetical protein
MMKNEEDERVLKHKKLDESKDDVKMKKMKACLEAKVYWMKLDESEDEKN